MPEAADFIGPTDGMVFVRQAQVRYTSGPWSFSAGESETTIIAVTVDAGGARFNTDDNVMPDFTGRWTPRATGALQRRRRCCASSSTVRRDRDRRARCSVSGKCNLGSNDDMRYMANAGSGFSRYMAFGLGTDTVLDARRQPGCARRLRRLRRLAAAFSPTLRTNLMYSAAHVRQRHRAHRRRRDRAAQSLHANIFYSPFPKLDVGAELMFGQREIENGLDGDLKRLQSTIKYSF